MTKHLKLAISSALLVVIAIISIIALAAAMVPRPLDVIVDTNAISAIKLYYIDAEMPEYEMKELSQEERDSFVSMVKDTNYKPRFAEIEIDTLYDFYYIIEYPNHSIKLTSTVVEKYNKTEELMSKESIITHQLKDIRTLN